MRWTFRGTPLTAVGKYICIRISGFDIPDIRGENLIIPLAPGRVHIDKVFDEGKGVLGISIFGTSLTDLETNITTLKALFIQRTEGALVRTLPGGGTQTWQAEIYGTMQLVYHSPTFAKATVSFIMADPLPS